MTQPTLPGLTPTWSTPHIQALKKAKPGRKHAHPTTCPTCGQPTITGTQWITDQHQGPTITADPTPLTPQATAWLYLYAQPTKPNHPLTVLAETTPGPTIKLWEDHHPFHPPPSTDQRLPTHTCDRRYPTTLHLPPQPHPHHTHQLPLLKGHPP